jgi:UDP-N-acetylmuramate--alanine ligase
VRAGATGRVHFIGIGGAGMSAIAKVLIERGVEVSGSDLKRSRAMAVLEAMGAAVTLGHDAAKVDGAGVVVASSAIPSRNPELVRAHELDLPVVSRGEALADLLSTSRSIIVAGTHGKTTTTSMITSVLLNAGLDPTYLIGGGLNDSGTNARSGRSELAVAESDESDGSFLLLTPHVAVVTNIELDHMDYWESLDALRDAFVSFIARTDQDGSVIVPATDDFLVDAATRSGRTVVTFERGGEVHASDVTLNGNGVGFVLHVDGAEATVQLRVPGLHNVTNALAAAAACNGVGVTHDEIAGGLERYRGVERRFQVKGKSSGVTVVDDYAHHPTEVRATLAAARPGPWSRVVAVFQPHRYSRTRTFSDEFGDSFGDADRVVVTDVYGAGELPVPGVTGKLVSDAVCRHLPGRHVAYLPHRAELIAYLEASARPGDVLLTLGAGDISSVGDELLVRLEERS